MVHIRSVIYALQDKGIVGTNVSIGQISGGTSSKVYLLEDKGKKMILKINDPEVIEQEVLFLNEYQSISKFPNVIYYDDKFQFFMMTYIPGKMIYRNESKESVLNQIDIFKDYQLANDDRVGYMDTLYTNFHEFLKANLLIDIDTVINYARIDEVFYMDKLDAMPLPNEHPKYVHGDFGYHNMLVSGDQITVIDPTPMQNLILYELLFMYFSTPYDINVTSLKSMYHLYLEYEEMTFDTFLFYAEVVCLLRIATCARHHSEEMPLYIEVFETIF